MAADEAGAWVGDDAEDQSVFPDHDTGYRYMTRRSLRTNGKRPDMVKVGAIHYKVSYVPDLKDDKGKLDGRIRHSQTEIHIDAGMNHQATTQTLLHEVVHAVVTQLGKQGAPEGLVDSLAYSIYQVMRDNPQLVKMITK
jgi:hypothetical protein